jgi:hypothetical protein
LRRRLTASTRRPQRTTERIQRTTTARSSFKKPPVSVVSLWSLCDLRGLRVKAFPVRLLGTPSAAVFPPRRRRPGVQ